MKRTQIQIPEPLYEKAYRLAEIRDWSLSEVIRRAVEQYVEECGHDSRSDSWILPEPVELGEEIVPYERWRDLVADDEGTSYGSID